MLRLIAKEPPIYRQEMSNKVGKPIYASMQSPQHSFIWDFQEISSGIYLARFQDTFHELSCEFTLELTDRLVPSEGEDDEDYLEHILLGNFPTIDSQRFQQKGFWDEYLHGMILIQFQLKVLEQLLLFCEHRYAAYLFLRFNEGNLDYIEIFERFIISENDTALINEELIEIIISTDVRVYDELLDFMEVVDHKFRQTLWREQRTHPLYRHYLKSEALYES